MRVCAGQLSPSANFAQRHLFCVNVVSLLWLSRRDRSYWAWNWRNAGGLSGSFFLHRLFRRSGIIHHNLLRRLRVDAGLRTL